MFPEIKGWRSSRRKQDIAARVKQIRGVFKDTPWNEELTEFSDFAGLRAMLFRADSSMVMFKSRSRSRDAYHLAALIAHQQLLDPTHRPQDRGQKLAEVALPERRHPDDAFLVFTTDDMENPAKDWTHWSMPEIK